MSARTVMKRAAELRSEGLDPSEALSEAWDEVRSNPRKSSSSTSYGDYSQLLMWAGILYFGWCGIGYYQTKAWSWTPWRLAGLGLRRRPMLTAPRQPTVPAGKFIRHDNIIEQPSRNGFESERVRLIMP
jgi:hypothetical protein